MSKKEPKVKDDDELHLNYLTVPNFVAHVKAGNTLCTDDEILILQNGSTTVEIRIPPKFEPKKFPWKEGLIRDIAWCPKLGVFIFLTHNSLYTFNPKSIAAAPTTTTNTDVQLIVTSYSKIKPFSDKNSFWRCTCVDTRVFISYSGERFSYVLIHI
jgi:hypothetical protein